MKKFILFSITTLLFSCGGGGGGTPVTITWSKVDNSCISDGGGYKVYYFTSTTDFGTDLSLTNLTAYHHEEKEVKYETLGDPNNPSTIIKVGKGYTYFKVSTYCSNISDSEPSIYSFVLVE